MRDHWREILALFLMFGLFLIGISPVLFALWWFSQRSP